MNFFKNILRRTAAFLLVLLCFHIPLSHAQSTVTSVFLILNDGAPITTAQDIRISLWSDGRLESGDITGGGAINGAAEHFSGYETVLTRTPDSNGRFKFSFGTLPGFPRITDQNQFMMIEYKEDADPDTAYVIYDDTYVGSSQDRFPLIINGPEIFQGVYTNDATTANTYTLDNDDTGGDVTLQFGDTLAETLLFSPANSQFEFSDDVNISGNLTLSGDIILNGTVDGVDVSTLGANSHAQNTDTGTDADSFIVNTDGNSATLQFGQTVNGQIVFDNAASTFDFDAK